MNGRKSRPPYHDIAEIAGFAVSTVLGWNPYEAWSLLQRFSSSFASKESWLDWVGRDWETIYFDEGRNVLELELLEKRYRLPQVIVFDNTIDALPPSEFHVSIDDEEPEYVVPARYTARNREIVDYYKRLKRSVLGSGVDLYDGSCARLRDFQEPTRTFVFQKSSYFDYLRSNLAMDNSHASLSLRRELHSASGSLQSLRDSPLANHLGINMLIFTSGGEAIVHRRSLEVLVRPKELCPSASGAVGYGDVERASTQSLTLENIPVHREVEEELGWRVSKEAKKNTAFLGLTRELIRGGKPEVFFSAVSSMSWEEVRECFEHCEGKQKRESTEVIPFDFSPYHCEPLEELEDPKRNGEFKRRLEFIIQELHHAGKPSIPLITNLALWYKYKMNGHT